MPKKTQDRAAVNAAQREFVANNCETHDEHALADATGLDVATCTTLRNEALASAARKRARRIGRVAEGVYAVDQSMSEMVDDAAKHCDPDQQRLLAERRATFITKCLPDD